MALSMRRKECLRFLLMFRNFLITFHWLSVIVVGYFFIVIVFVVIHNNLQLSSLLSTAFLFLLIALTTNYETVSELYLCCAIVAPGLHHCCAGATPYQRYTTAILTLCLIHGNP